MDRFDLLYLFTGIIIGLLIGMGIMAYILFRKYPHLQAILKLHDTGDIVEVFKK